MGRFRYKRKEKRPHHDGEPAGARKAFALPSHLRPHVKAVFDRGSPVTVNIFNNRYKGNRGCFLVEETGIREHFRKTKTLFNSCLSFRPLGGGLWAFENHPPTSSTSTNLAEVPMSGSALSPSRRLPTGVAGALSPSRRLQTGASGAAETSATRDVNDDGRTAPTSPSSISQDNFELAPRSATLLSASTPLGDTKTKTSTSYHNEPAHDHAMVDDYPPPRTTQSASDSPSTARDLSAGRSALPLAGLGVSKTPAAALLRVPVDTRSQRSRRIASDLSSEGSSSSALLKGERAIKEQDAMEDEDSSEVITAPSSSASSSFSALSPPPRTGGTNPLSAIGRPAALRDSSSQPDCSMKDDDPSASCASSPSSISLATSRSPSATYSLSSSFAISPPPRTGCTNPLSAIGRPAALRDSSSQPDDSMTDDDSSVSRASSPSSPSVASSRSSLAATSRSISVATAHAAQHPAPPSRSVPTSVTEVAAYGSRSISRGTSGVSRSIYRGTPCESRSTTRGTPGGLRCASEPTSAGPPIMSHRQHLVSKGVPFSASSAMTPAALAPAEQLHPNSAASSQRRFAAAVEGMVDEETQTSTPELSPASSSRAELRKASSWKTAPATSADVEEEISITHVALSSPSSAVFSAQAPSALAASASSSNSPFRLAVGAPPHSALSEAPHSSSSSSSSSHLVGPLPQVPLIHTIGERSAMLTNSYGEPIAEDASVPVVAYHLDCEEHIEPDGVKCEVTGRVRTIVEYLHKQGTLREVGHVRVRVANEQDLFRAQSKELTADMMRRSEEAKETGPTRLPDDADMYVSAGTAHAVCVAYGAGLELTNWLATRENKTGVAIIRPPGHHGKRKKPSGFCWANNLVGSVTQFLEHLEKNNVPEPKVVILDWDGHHGDGIEDEFENDPRVVYLSIHRDTMNLKGYSGGFFPFWPRGQPGKTGYLGRNINIPVDIGTGDRGYILIFLSIVVPLLVLWSPHGIFVACGLDAHQDDPLVGLNLSSSGFALMTRILYVVARQHLNILVAFFLEGGYAFKVLRKEIDTILKILLGKDDDHPHTYTTVRSGVLGFPAAAYIADKEAKFDEHLLRLVRWFTLKSGMNFLPAYEAALNNFPRDEPSVLARATSHPGFGLPRVEYQAASSPASSMSDKAESIEFVDRLIEKTIQIVNDRCRGSFAADHSAADIFPSPVPDYPPGFELPPDAASSTSASSTISSSSNAPSTSASSTGLTSNGEHSTGVYSNNASSNNAPSTSVDQANASSNSEFSDNAPPTGASRAPTAQQQQQLVAVSPHSHVPLRPRSTRKAALKSMAGRRGTKQADSADTASAPTATSSSGSIRPSEGTGKRKVPPATSKSPHPRGAAKRKRKKRKPALVDVLTPPPSPPSRARDPSAQATPVVDPLPALSAATRGRNRSASMATPSAAGRLPPVTPRGRNRSASETTPPVGYLPPVALNKRSASATTPATPRRRKRSVSETTPPVGYVPPVVLHKRSASATTSATFILPPGTEHSATSAKPDGGLPPALEGTPHRPSHVAIPIVGSTQQPGFSPLPTTATGVPGVKQMPPPFGASSLPFGGASAVRRHSLASTPSAPSPLSAPTSAGGPPRVVRAQSASLPSATAIGHSITPSSASVPLSMHSLANALPALPPQSNALTSPPFLPQAPTNGSMFSPATLASLPPAMNPLSVDAAEHVMPLSTTSVQDGMSGGVLLPPLSLSNASTLPASQSSTALGADLAKWLPPPLVGFPIPSPTGSITPLATPTDNMASLSTASTPASTPGASSSGLAGTGNSPTPSVFTFGTSSSLPPPPPPTG